MYDRAAILRTAHASARKRMAPSFNFRHGDRWNNEAGGYVPHGLTYREAFAAALRWAWRDAKIIAEEQAWAATQPAIPDEVAEHVAAIRAAAWFEPINGTGNERYRALHAQADAIECRALELCGAA